MVRIVLHQLVLGFDVFANPPLEGRDAFFTEDAVVLLCVASTRNPEVGSLPM